MDGKQRPRSIAMDDHTYALLQREADDRGMTISQLVRRLVAHSLDPKNFTANGEYGRITPERIKQKLALLLTGMVMVVGFLASVGVQSL